MTLKQHLLISMLLIISDLLIFELSIWHHAYRLIEENLIDLDSYYNSNVIPKKSLLYLPIQLENLPSFSQAYEASATGIRTCDLLPKFKPNTTPPHPDSSFGLVISDKEIVEPLVIFIVPPFFLGFDLIYYLLLKYLNILVNLITS